MGRVSRRRLHKDAEERIYEVFWEHVASLPTRALVREFLQSILSPTEQMMIAKRLAIAILLTRGHTYDAIDERLKVSKATVAIIDRQLTQGSPGYERAIQTATKQRSKEVFWDALEDVLMKVSLPAREGSGRHAFKSALGSDMQKRKRKRDVL